MMTEFIAHRINTKAQLCETPDEFGLEIDLRDYGDRLVLQHDPFIGGEDFEDWLSGYHHRTIILNIKSERIEHRVLELLRSYHVAEYFFLDSSFPMIFSLSTQGERNIAVRYSELESFDNCLALADRVSWVWVDCFTRLPITNKEYKLLKSNGLKLCLVSPDLIGRPEDIKPYRQQLERDGIVFDAICTKTDNIPIWKD
jgi:hypothetical protein